ncbi:MAG: hypothetical protein BGO94_06045 [Micrococcales bacterium 72-143]|nr:MAG: hypothetical protein BGO94_06045 [Micrococcales bacterium 72-143]
MPEPGILVMYVAGGAVAGVLAKLADGPVTWLGDLATYLAVWVLGVTLIGAFAPSAPRAAARASAAFVSVCVGYYGFAVVVLGYPVGRESVVWVLLSLTLVPAIASLVRIARTADRWWSSIVIATVAAMCVADDAIARVVIALTEDVPEAFMYSVRPIQAIINVVSAVVVVLVAPRSWRVRWWALLAAVPLAFVGAMVMSEARSTLGV